MRDIILSQHFDRDQVAGVADIHFPRDDFDRELFCILGLPFDVEKLDTAIDKIHQAVLLQRKVFLTTPNLNFIIGAKQKKALRRSVINSQMVVVDGMPLLLVSRLLGLPISERVAGSTLFECLHDNAGAAGKLKVFFFGGQDGVAQRAHEAINANSQHLYSVGYLNPGFQSVEEMSMSHFLDQINHAAPDFLVVALGAQKGQLWIDRNLENLNVKVVSHLGAVINFAAGTVKRAPECLQRCGLEWLWRIKEEPYLWKRYFKDGLAFLYLLLFKVIPLGVYSWFVRNIKKSHQACSVKFAELNGRNYLQLDGNFLTLLSVEQRHTFRTACQKNSDIFLDFANTGFIGASLVAYILILKKQLNHQGRQLQLVNLKPLPRLLLKWHCVDYLLLD